jgi:methylglutamate dehydrogenase subunit C
MSAFRRLERGGRIDRGKAISFSYAGKLLSGFEGDTLASALLGSGQTLIGRSFKYHRPRGFLGSGAEEPNGLFTVHGVPNIPGTTLELRPGLEVKPQNAWPSLAIDAMAINSLAAPFLQTGFYYKTFMGPVKKAWMFYEPFIRRAAGLGANGYEADTRRYDTRHEHCDLLVIGGGAAGLAAALTAGRSGARVVLAEQDFDWGGALLADLDKGLESWRLAHMAEFAQLPNVSVRLRTTVQGLYDGDLAVLEDQLGVICLRFSAVIHAAGAIERPLVFPNNDRPGVMLAGALRTYLNRFGIAPRQRCAIVTNNDTAYEAAFDLAQAGVAVTIADHRQIIPADLLSKSAMLGMAIFPATGVGDVAGSKQVRSVRFEGRHSAEIECDCVGMSGGWSPVVHLTSHGGIKPAYDDRIAAFVPGGFAPQHFGAGAVLGDFGFEAALKGGAEAAAKAGFAGKPVSGLHRKDRAYHILPVWQCANGDKAFVDFQNDVALKDVRTAHQEGYQSVEHLKRYTTLGMGTDQGKTSNINALAIMAGLRDVTIPQAGTTTFRPPYTGLSVGAIAGRTIGPRFRPVRRSPLHQWHEDHGGVFIEAGLWKRTWYYRWAGNSPEIAYVKEMDLVRRGAGIADVSTLGKIDVQGPDAAEFLNRVYVNGFAKLPVGKARYGVMLNDDGVVLDDGTAARISENQFYVTTTTAQAGEVMSWFEYLLQCHWTDLKVHVTSLTDEWGGMAVSGPKSRDALQLAFPRLDLSNEALPYMGVRDFAFGGTTVRLMRLSFSGELAYEVHVSAGFAVDLWEHILKAGEPVGIKPYGLEALASLRIEKGHVAGLELDHRNTLDDLGLGRMAGKEKAYVGKELRFRKALQAPDRWSLIGIEGPEDGAKLRGGAILFAANDEIKGHGRGYITSVTWSTELNRFIALGLYQGGLKYEGEDIVCAFPLKNEQVKARIVSPHFIDKEGARLHG